MAVVVTNLGICLKISYVIFAFCAAFFLGALKGFQFFFFFSSFVGSVFLCFLMMGSFLKSCFLKQSLIFFFYIFLYFLCRFDRRSNCWFNINSWKCWSDSWFVPCTCYLDYLRCCKVRKLQLCFSLPLQFLSQRRINFIDMVFLCFSKMQDK